MRSLVPVRAAGGRVGGKIRHVKVQCLWIHDAVENKELNIEKVGTLENPADMLTKFLASVF